MNDKIKTIILSKITEKPIHWLNLEYPVRSKFKIDYNWSMFWRSVHELITEKLVFQSQENTNLLSSKEFQPIRKLAKLKLIKGKKV